MAISVENCQFFPPHVFNALPKGSPWNFVSAQGVKKFQWWGYQTVKK